MKKDGILILAQADHLTGEEIGFAIDQIMAWGANNVYAFPGITKKNRTGCVLMIDVDPDDEKEWTRRLAKEFSIYGYHRILSSHYCSPCRTQSCAVAIRKGTACFETEVRFKMPEGGDGPCRSEHADLVHLREQVHQKLKEAVSLTKLRMELESQATSDLKSLIEIVL